MSDIDPSAIIAAVVFFAFLALGIDTFMTRICPECRKRCRRERSPDKTGVKLYRCNGCQTLLLGSKPPE